MFDLLAQFDTEVSDNEFTIGLMNAFDNRSDKHGYLYSHADPAVIELIESNAILIDDEQLNNLLSTSDESQKIMIKAMLSDALVLGYLDQIYYVDKLFGPADVTSLPARDLLGERIREYHESLNGFRPLNMSLETVIDYLQTRITSSDKLAYLGDKRADLIKYVNNSIYTGQLMAVLQGYRANINKV